MKTAALAAGYIGTILGANWALQQFGAIPVGGLFIPAGTLFAGLAFTLRDLLHERIGGWWTIAVILIGIACSALVSPTFALASGIAFGVSELADLAAYAPLRKRHFYLAVTLSNTVGMLLDSVLFLLLAFGSLAFLPGQIVGKALMTVLALIVLRGGHAVLSRNTSPQLAR